jgi:hypothetical protein
MAVRALAWMGQAHGQEALVKIRQKISKEEWKVMVASRASFPEWIARLLGEAGQLG